MPFPYHNLNMNNIQGANVARIGCSIWMPLNGDTANANTQIKPDITIFDLKDLLNILPISEYCHSDSTTKTMTMMKNTLRRNSGPSTAMKTTTATSMKRLHQPISLSDLDLDNGNSNSSDGS